MSDYLFHHSFDSFNKLQGVYNRNFNLVAGAAKHQACTTDWLVELCHSSVVEQNHEESSLLLTCGIGFRCCCEVRHGNPVRETSDTFTWQLDSYCVVREMSDTIMCQYFNSGRRAQWFGRKVHEVNCHHFLISCLAVLMREKPFVVTFSILVRPFAMY